MRWNKKKKSYIGNGETRIVTKFLFFPKCLWNQDLKKYEYRWLEFAKIEQEYKRSHNYKYWKDIHWGWKVLSE